MSVFPTADGRSADSWIAAMDPRLRILAATALALTVVSLHRLPELLLAFGSSALLASTGGLCWRRLARRLLALEGFMLLVLLTLPFTVPGEPWWNVGGLSASEEGLRQAASILLRANTVVLGLLGLMGSMEPVTLGHALGRLHAPEKLVHLLLFTVRYLGLLDEELRRLRQAMRARAFAPRTDRHTWNSLGWLLGMLLIRSLERSQRILAAMRCRGFQGRFYLLEDERWRSRDTALCLVFALALVTLLGLDRLT